VKKLFVFLTAFTLVAALVAADVNVGGSFDIMAKTVKGDTWSDNEPSTSLVRDLIITIGGETDDGAFGAKGALTRGNTADTAFWIYAFWKPVKQVMIKMGAVFEENTWATTDITGTGLEGPHFNKFSIRPTEDYAGGVLKAGTGFFAPAMTYLQIERTLQLSFYPIKGLAINLGVPMDFSTYNTAEYNYIDKLHAQAVYAIDGIGEAAVSFINAPDDPREFQNVFVQWKMPIGDSIKLELGLNIGMNAKLTAPLNIGLGFGWGNMEKDPLVLNVRAGASLPMEDTQDTNIGFDVVPSYDFQILRVYVPFGIGVNLPAGDGDSQLHWSFNPYVAKNLGGPFFYAGLQLYSNVVRDGIEWSIPLGFRWDF
jgi:hypothetical protein